MKCKNIFPALVAFLALLAGSTSALAALAFGEGFPNQWTPTGFVLPVEHSLAMTGTQFTLQLPKSSLELIGYRAGPATLETLVTVESNGAVFSVDFSTYGIGNPNPSSLSGIWFDGIQAKEITVAPAGTGFSPWEHVELNLSPGVHQVAFYANMTDITSNAVIVFQSPTLAAIATPVPIPAAVWLFGSALAGLGVFGRRRSAV